MGSITTRGGSEKIGDIKIHAVNAVPPGWLVCDGALISRVAYGALFEAIGGIYGAGDGVNTFALPDMRGEFPRGWDGGRGVDAGRWFGSAQAHALISHSHTVNYAEVYVPGQEVVGTISTGGNGGPKVSTSAAGGGNETRPRNVAMLFCIKYAG